MAERIAAATEKIRQRQEAWRQDLERLEAGFQAAGELLHSSEQFFTGTPVKALREKGIEEQEKGMCLLTNLKAHLLKLHQIAGVYEQAERSNVNAAPDHRSAF